MAEAMKGADCIVVGGCADGVLLHDVRPTAGLIQLRRPEYLKPIGSPSDKEITAAFESDLYEIHPLSLQNSDEEKPRLFAIAVVEGQTLSWAFSQLVIAFVEQATEKAVKELP